MAQCPWGWDQVRPQEQQDRVQDVERLGMLHEPSVDRCPGFRSVQPCGSLSHSAGSWPWGGLWTVDFGRGVMPLIHSRKTAGEWSLVAELVNTSHTQSYCSPLVFSFADFCSYFRPAGGLMYPTACLVFLLIISVSLKKDITSLCKP